MFSRPLEAPPATARFSHLSREEVQELSQLHWGKGCHLRSPYLKGCVFGPKYKPTSHGWVTKGLTWIPRTGIKAAEAEEIMYVVYIPSEQSTDHSGVWEPN